MHTTTKGVKLSPIKAENRAKYPRNWSTIRQEALLRAGDHCEWCGLANHTLINKQTRQPITSEEWHAAQQSGVKLTKQTLHKIKSLGWTRVVLTVAQWTITLPTAFPLTLPSCARSATLTTTTTASNRKWTNSQLGLDPVCLVRI